MPPLSNVLSVSTPPTIKEDGGQSEWPNDQQLVANCVADRQPTVEKPVLPADWKEQGYRRLVMPLIKWPESHDPDWLHCIGTQPIKKNVR